MTKHHYVYHSYEEWGREYIGVRSCNCLPEEDTKYFGSFYDKTFKPTEKTILFVCETRAEVLEIEIELHNFFDVAVNPQFANMVKQTSTGFDTTGLQSGKNNPMYGRTGEKNPNYGNTGALNPRSKAIIAIQPDGTQRHYGGVLEAARELEIPKSSLSKHSESGHVLTQGPRKGWQFIHKNPMNRVKNTVKS